MTATTARRVHHNYREYLEALDVSTVKLEFCEGEIERTADGWSQTDYGAGQRLRVTALELELAVDELYAGITLDP